MALRRLSRAVRRRAFPIFVVLTLLFPFVVEMLIHRTKWTVPLPDPKDVDGPFETGCREPDTSQPREKAALVMLTRNKELEQAKHSVESIERHFNRWYHYPIVFFNDEEWDQRFIDELNATVSGEARFEVIPQDVWSFPPWIDVDKAKASIKDQGERGIAYGGLEGYHHMCRFYSGHFYTLPALKEFEWYWRLEPDVDFMCAITYDPFVEMRKRGKIYGYAQALWEVTESCPSLFMEMNDWKESHRIPTNNLWRAMMQASWVPFPLRRLFAAPNRDHDRFGDKWSRCHYWSNFEIAKMEFFRSKEYQDLFEYLDKKGGFYYERVCLFLASTHPQASNVSFG